MKILVIANNFPWPGHRFDGMFNLRYVKALEERGHTVRVVRFVPHLLPWTRYGKIFAGLVSPYEIEGVPVQIVRGWLGPRRYGLGTLRAQLGARLRREAAAFAPDVVHAHGLLDAGLLATTIDAPLVVTAHGSETYRLPWLRAGLQALARDVVRSATVMTAVSAYVASHVAKLGRADVEVIFNGADDAIFTQRDRAPARATCGIAPDRPVLLYAGQLIAAKGLAELATALAALAPLRPQLIVAGEGPFGASFARDLHANGIAARFFGTVDQPMLATLMAAADAVVLPSHAEGLPTVLCEAMNAGRAIVATSVGGIPEIVRDGVSGFLVPVHAPEPLADRLRTVLENAPLRRSMEEHAKAYAQTHLTWSVNAQAYEQLYLRITETRSPSRAPEGRAEAAGRSSQSNRRRAHPIR